MRKTIFLILSVTSFVLLSLKVSSPADAPIGVTQTLQFFRNGAGDFLLANQRLYAAIGALDADSSTLIRARRELAACRSSYKKTAFFTAYFFASETRFYNAAPKFEVEEPTLELIEPMGLQQIETLLFEDEVLSHKSNLLNQSEAMLTSAGDLTSLLYGLEISDAQILESMRIELIRISTLYISGYDAPLLKSGISETREATLALQTVLKPYLESRPGPGRSLAKLLGTSLSYLDAHQDFDSFNRMEYLTQFALPMQEEFGRFVSGLGLELNTTKFLNDQAPHIYSKIALKNLGNEAVDFVQNRFLADLGRVLFFDKSLSGNASVSCATCHRPENYFTDGLRKSPSLVADSVLKRNTPTLLYTGWQHTQFWDGRAANLAGQIHEVIFNPLEMNGSKEGLNRDVLQQVRYRKLVTLSFPGKDVQAMGMPEVSEALAAFVRQLGPMDSPFDRYILFMGKAQCGTCHFPPFFNSLLPPLFALSEVEILGVTATDDFEHPETDPDPGRFDLYKMKYYKGAFKTPTVRNTAKTAPYMHNGAFKTLDKVIDFYNKGGGRGLTLPIEEQTLSARPLNLSEHESQDIILFLESLTDSNLK
jgi:cytochrome c peroxidase